jgi:hypothetical protein
LKTTRSIQWITLILAVLAISTPFVLTAKAQPDEQVEVDSGLRSDKAADSPKEDVSVWRKAAAGFDDTCVSYQEENGPSKLQVSCLRHEEGAPQTVEEMHCRRRASVTSMRHGSMRRYERREEATVDITVATPRWEVDKHYVQTRTLLEFKYVDKLKRRASIWSEFRWDPWTVLDVVTPPAAEEGTFTPVNGNEHTWEFRPRDGKRVVRYRLDPDKGMMPTRVETYQAGEPLFLLRIVEIPLYEKHGVTFFPAEATFYNNIGTGSWDSKDVHRLRKVETEMKYTSTDFNLEFAPDVRVSDHRAPDS